MGCFSRVVSRFHFILSVFLSEIHFFLNGKASHNIQDAKELRGTSKRFINTSAPFLTGRALTTGHAENLVLGFDWSYLYSAEGGGTDTNLSTRSSRGQWWTILETGLCCIIKSHVLCMQLWLAEENPNVRLYMFGPVQLLTSFMIRMQKLASQITTAGTSWITIHYTAFIILKYVLCH